MLRRSLLSAVVVITAGSLLHFAWEWSDRRAWVAVISATNESTWEHLKIAFWPALLLTPLQRAAYGALPGWFPATAIRCLLPSILIVALFYGYTALLGSHHLAADIAVFALAILVGEVVGHATLTREFGQRTRFVAIGLLILATALFASMTFRPPDWFLFRDPGSTRRIRVHVVPLDDPDAGRLGRGTDDGDGSRVDDAGDGAALGREGRRGRPEEAGDEERA